MSILKWKYNKMLDRFNNACAFIESADDDKVEKWKPEFNKLCREMSECILEMDKQNVTYTEDELINGFNEKSMEDEKC